MYQHSTDLVRTITDERLRNSESHRQIASMVEGKSERAGWMTRIASFRPTTRRASTSPAQ